MKKISILGSTGKIGEVSLKIIEKKKNITQSIFYRDTKTTKKLFIKLKNINRKYL